MNDQWIKDWNERFLKNDVPWEESVPSQLMCDLFTKHVQKGADVLEIGCGSGANAIWLARHGYGVTAVDISPEAVRRARKSAEVHGTSIDFRLCNILGEEADGLPEFSVSFDKGCLHSFNTEAARRRYCDKVASLLKPGGVWINISGNADNGDDPEKIEKFGYPRLSAKQIVDVVEDRFEILGMAQCWYYNDGSPTNFKAWACVFKRRI